MATFDKAVWKCALGTNNGNAICVNYRGAGVLRSTTDDSGLPSGDGSIAVLGAAPNQIVRITVRWQEPNAANPSSISIDSEG